MQVITFVGLTFRSYKELLEVTKRKAAHYAKDRNRNFTDETQMAYKHRKRCSVFLVTRELEIKTTYDLIYHPPDWQTLKCLSITRLGQNVESQEVSRPRRVEVSAATL